MISLSYHIKNTGKTDLNLQNMYFEIVYGDGYRFKSDDLSEYHYLKNENWENYAPDCYIILPLNNREYRACIEVPAEVFENTDAPLKFELHTSSETVFTYNIR